MSQNPFTARLAAAAQQGYIGTGRPCRGAKNPTTGAIVSPVAFPVPAEALSSPRQQAFMEGLLEEKDLTVETRPKFIARVEALADAQARRNLTKDQASSFIDYLLALPRREVRPTADKGAIPAGRYAVEIDEVLWFVKVDAPTEGRWAGYTFVERQLSDEYVRINRRQADEVKAAIRKVGAETASKRYGHELGECGVCGRTLTNESSRAAGIGPKCASNVGW